MKVIGKKLYDILRILQIVIPGVAACYAALAKIWGWPYGTEIVGTAAAIVALLGIFLKIDSDIYFNKENEDEQNG